MVVAGLLAATEASASASFANRNLGLGVSGFGILGEHVIGIDWGVPITLEGGLYIESGFEIFIHPQFMILQVPFGAATPTGAGGIFGFGGHLGTRYLFLEESIRPYVAIQVAVLGLATTPDAKVFVGPGASLLREAQKRWRTSLVESIPVLAQVGEQLGNVIIVGDIALEDQFAVEFLGQVQDTVTHALTLIGEGKCGTFTVHGLSDTVGDGAGADHAGDQNAFVGQESHIYPLVMSGWSKVRRL